MVCLCFKGTYNKYHGYFCKGYYILYPTINIFYVCNVFMWISADDLLFLLPGFYLILPSPWGSDNMQIQYIHK